MSSDEPNPYVVLVRTRVVEALLVALVGAAAVAGCGDNAVNIASPGGEPSTTVPCSSTNEQGQCGVPFEELRRQNLHYADRVDFAGDIDSAFATADEVRAAVEPLAATQPAPSVAAVREALAPWEPNVEVTDNAVRMAGIAFAIAIDGGCVFGAIYAGEVSVDVGGYLNDGGCLAVNAH